MASAVSASANIELCKLLSQLALVELGLTMAPSDILSYEVQTIFYFGSSVPKNLIKIRYNNCGDVRSAEFFVGDAEYRRITDLMGTNYLPVPNSLQPPVVNNLMNQTPPLSNKIGNTSLRCVPKMIDFEEGDDSTVAWWTIRCDCTNTYFCNHVTHEFFLGSIFPKITPLLDRDKQIRLCLPIFGCILFPVLLKKLEIQDWEGKKSQKLFVSTDTFENFYDYPPRGIQSTLFVSIIEERQHSVDSSRVLAIENAMNNGNANPLLMCNSKTHHYGSNARFLKWINEGRETGIPFQTRIAAALFCTREYGFCHACYIDRMPAFSLIDL